MMAAAIAMGTAAVAAWLYLLLGRGGFWRVHRCSTWNICGKAQNGNPPGVVAVVPARNERETIGRCVASLLRQEYAGRLHVIVVDDESTDGTAEAAREAENPHPVAPKPGATSVGQPRLTVIRGKARPAGWSGKVWAMKQGVEASREPAPRYFLFTDADVAHAPGSLATLVTIAEEGKYDLASFMVRLHCEGVTERLLIPAFVFFFFMIYPPRWIADARKRTAGAAGGCMLVRKETLERAGGLEAIRGEVIDDCALATVIKRSGRAWLGLSEDTASLRAYGGFADIGRMIARTAFNQLRHSGRLLAGALAGMAIAFVAPVALLLAPTSAGPGQMGGSVAIGLGAVAWSLMTIAYLPMVRFYRLNPLWAVTLPAAAVFYMGATVWSAVRYWMGRGGEWKGRVQDQRSSAGIPHGR